MNILDLNISKPPLELLAYKYVYNLSIATFQ